MVQGGGKCRPSLPEAIMETNVNYTIVGVFVISLLLAIVLGIIWLSSGFSLKSYTNYLVYMKESISGLNLDSPVEFNGVDVGVVKKIKIDQKNPQLVEVLISIQSDTPVTIGTEATLNTRGFTGVTYMTLKDKGLDLRPLVALEGQTYPVIKTSPSLLLRLDAALTHLTKNFRKVANSIQAVLDQGNLASIKQILINLQNVSANLAANNQKLSRIMENTARATRDLSPLMQQSISTLRTLETQTLPSTYRFINHLDQTSRTLNEIVQDLKQNPSMLIRGVDRSGLGPGETQ